MSRRKSSSQMVVGQVIIAVIIFATLAKALTILGVIAAAYYTVKFMR